MKKLFASILSASAIAFAADVQILAPTGADFSDDAPNMVQSLVRAAVTQSGNTPASESEIQLRTNLMTMGSSIVVVVEQVKGGEIVASGKQKSQSLDELDVAIEQATLAALANLKSDEEPTRKEPAAAEPPRYADDERDEPRQEQKSSDADVMNKRPTRNYVGYGLGIAAWHNWEDSESNPKMDWAESFVFHYARIFECTPHGAITIINNMNMSFGDEWQWHEAFLIGGRYYISTSSVSPFAGAGLGLGLQNDEHFGDADESFAIGLAGGAELGVVFFRNSAVQLEVGFAWDALWDGFKSFDRRFGAGSFYVSVNY